MNLAEAKDKTWIFKESLKSKVLDSPLLNKLEAKSFNFSMLIRALGLKKIKKVINGKPNSIIMIADEMVVRVPLDKLTATRYRLSAKILRKLQSTSIAAFVPRILETGKFQNYTYYCEEKLPGLAIDIPISKMDAMVSKAADFITKFHQKTASNIIINELYFKRLIGREFERLYPYLEGTYKAKLQQIEKFLKKQLICKTFKTVWFHGDFNIENTLFDTKTWNLKGVIDWDLSREEGLPFLDIFYLLTYKNSLIAKESISITFKEKLLELNLSVQDKEIINRYSTSLNISEYFVVPLLIMFWINHITQRYRQQLTNNALQQQGGWRNENVYSVMDAILSLLMKK